MQIIQQTLEYDVYGRQLRSILYRPQGRAGVPGVLVIPDIHGLREQARERAMKLAQLGYAALAMDLHSEGRRMDDPKEALSELEQFSSDPSEVFSRTEESHAILRAQEGVDASRTAAIGFCYGGTLALELCRRGSDLRAVAAFHSVLSSSIPAEKSRLQESRTKILACVGSEDPIVPAAQRSAFESEMREAKIDWQLHVYGGVLHSFTDPRATLPELANLARYDARADKRSWAAMETLLAEAFS